ncbi:MAG: sodium:solute symporter [Candidatus Brocadiia bacterium]
MGDVSRIDLAVIAVYILGITVLGCTFVRRERSTERFFLAGRRLPWWAVGLSIFGTQLSAITFMAIPGRAYATDWTWLVGNVMIAVMAPVIAFVYLPFFRRAPITSAYEYLESRFHPRLRDYGGLAFVLMQLGRMGVVLYLPALALSEVTGLSVVAMVVVVGLLIIVYTVMGGIEAVIWTDVVQVVVLLGGALYTVALIASDVGGLGAIVRAGQAAGKLRLVRWTADPTVEALWLLVVGGALTQLIPYGSDQTVVQRYLTTRTEREARRSILLNGAMCIPSSLLFFFIGTALFAYYQAHPSAEVAALKMDRVYPYFIVHVLPPGVAGLVIAAVFAASMSSLDSSLNSVSTVCVNDFYRRYVNPRASDRRALAVARCLTVFWGLLATAIAAYMAVKIQQNPEHKGAWHTFVVLLGLLGGGLAGLFVLGLFVPRATWQGALVGVVASAGALYAATRLDLKALFGDAVEGHTLHKAFGYPLVGIVACVVAGAVASLLFAPRPPAEVAPYTVQGTRRATRAARKSGKETRP